MEVVQQENCEQEGAKKGAGGGTSGGGTGADGDGKTALSAAAAADNGESSERTSISDRTPSVGSRSFIRPRTKGTRCVIKGQMKFVPTWNAILCICSPLYVQIISRY